MRHLTKYRLFEDYEYIRLVMRDILTDIILDGIEVDIFASNNPQIKENHINLNILKVHFVKKFNTFEFLKFDIKKYKDDYLQLIRYMEEEGYKFYATLFKNTYSKNRISERIHCSTNEKWEKSYLTFDELLEESTKGTFCISFRFYKF